MTKNMEKEVREIYEKIELSEERKTEIFQKILRGEKKEEKGMGKWMKAVILVLCLLTGGGSVYAAVHYLRADEAAEKMGQSKLAKKFAKLTNKVVTQEDDTYKVSYLGEVTGKKLTDLTSEIAKEQTYFVLAVEKKGKKKISADDTIVASPFVKGIAPWQLNIFWMDGGAEGRVIGDVRYIIFQSDNWEIFADRGLYLGVCDSAPGADQYSFEEKTGEIKKNEDYQGLNLLFKLDIDPSRADRTKAEKYLDQLKKEQDVDEAEQEKTDQKSKTEQSKKAEREEKFTKEVKRFEKMSDQKKIEYVKKNGTVISDSVKTVKPSKNSTISYKYYKNKDCFWETTWKPDEYKEEYELDKEEYGTGTEILTGYAAIHKEFVVVTKILNENGTMTMQAYQINVP